MSLKDIFKKLLGGAKAQESSKSSNDIFEEKSVFEETPSTTPVDKKVPKKKFYSGSETQFDEVGDSNLQLYIGLDFGTAFTKVVVSDSLKNYAVPLTDNERDEKYLLPTSFSESNAICSLNESSGVVHNNLKMALINGELSDHALTNAAIYLALVFRKIRSYILNEKQSLFQGNRFIWLINVGLPTEGYANKKINKAYSLIVSSAWDASTASGEITRPLVEKCIKLKKQGNSSDQSLADDAVGLIPEFVAQVTGYVRSPRRQSDLHMLIDIGAGTLDATTFNVHEKEGEDRFPIFAKAVASLGTRFLVKSRIETYLDLKEDGVLSPFSPVPSKKIFSKLLKVSLDGLSQMDASFRKKVSDVINQIQSDTKQPGKYPESRRWDEGLPVFLCGGGAEVDFYQESIFGHKNSKLIKMHLPKPDALEAPDLLPANYSRLSVAYGLSFDHFDIGEIIKEDEIQKYNNDPVLATGNSSPVCPSCSGNGGLHRTCNRCGGSGFLNAG